MSGEKSGVAMMNAATSATRGEAILRDLRRAVARIKDDEWREIAQQRVDELAGRFETARAAIEAALKNAAPARVAGQTTGLPDEPGNPEPGGSAAAHATPNAAEIALFSNLGTPASVEPSATPNATEQPERWAVFCGICDARWSVPYRHPGKSVCDECEKRYRGTQSHARQSEPMWLVRAGGDGYDTWLCATREDVRKAFCEALYGNPASADAEDIDGYMRDFDKAWREREHDVRWTFEDGWLEAFPLAPAGTRSATQRIVEEKP